MHNSIEKIKDIVLQDKAIILRNGKSSKIKNVEFLGNRQCFDIEVENKDHLFLLNNGVITSNSKHTSGAYKGKKDISGLKYIEQFTESPETFADKAAVAEEDGKIQKIEDAPQGGKYIYINDNKIYVLPEMDINVKVGDEVEAGDILSDGLADPEDIVRYKGLGAGRKYWATRFKQLLEDSGGAASLRNTEVVARNILNKIEITDPDGFGSYLPGDIVSYNKVEEDYEPRENSKDIDLKQDSNNALNKYLEEPVLYHTIGTRVTKSMLKELKELGIDNILVNDEPPGFEPITVRMREAAMKGNDDWLSRMSSSYIKSNLIDAAARGLDTNINENTNPYARMGKAYDFGKNIEKGKF